MYIVIEPSIGNLWAHSTAPPLVFCSQYPSKIRERKEGHQKQFKQGEESFYHTLYTTLERQHNRPFLSVFL